MSRARARTEWTAWAHVALAAIALTLANAAKPLVVDDTAYTYYARQIAALPTDPYGFEILWYDRVEPAFGVLAPPVLPYWLAGSIRLFGDEPLLWKLALFPFALAFAASLRRLLARFAPQTATPLLWMGVLSPPVLPFFNLMLDVPSTALALCALATFLSACDRGSLAGAAASGLLAGLAMQTKYTGATALAAMLVYGALFARLRLALVAAGIGAAIFAGWEALMAARYGESHLVRAILLLWPQRRGVSVESAALWTAGFTILVGALAAPIGLLGLAALRVRTRLVGFGGLALALCFAGIPFLAGVSTPKVQIWPLLRGAPAEQSLFLLLGLATTASVATAAWRLAMRREPEGLFLVAWLAIELTAFAVLSPFLAARRVLGASLVALLICARALPKLEPAAVRAAVRIPVASGIGLGILFAAADFSDAHSIRGSVGLAEHELRALGADRERETVWFAGHWGFQFYAERAGMRALAPGASRLERGDWIVVSDGISKQPFQASDVSLPLARVDAHSASPWCTHPWAYGGAIPMRRRPEANLRLWIHRVNADFVPGAHTSR